MLNSSATCEDLRPRSSRNAANGCLLVFFMIEFVTRNVTTFQEENVTREAVAFSWGVTDTYAMDRNRPRHFIHEWRKSKAGLSLRRLADRLTNPDGSSIISYASLSRIEKGKQEYTQPILEGIADAIGTDPGSLIMRNPESERPLWSIWDQIPPQDREQALRVLKSFARSGTDG